MTICIIPARGGSKRIPRKNIREFHGRPIIGWSITAALESAIFDRVIVSTDDREIASVAQKEGAEVPFIRPTTLSTDQTATRPVIQHAISMLESTHDDICCVYPTAPFLSNIVLCEAYQYFKDTNSDFVFSAATYPAPIQRSFRILNDGSAERIYPEHRWSRSQDLETAYHDAGQFYWGKGQAFMTNVDSVSPNGRPFLISRDCAHDIDTPEDWQLAELMFAAHKRNSDDTI